MIRILHVLLGLAMTSTVMAQTLHNQWIDYSQQYLRIPIVEDGLYRIDYAALNTALATVNQNIATLDPRGLQVFGRGEQIYIHVEGESDGVFGTNDFIEFYAKKNDGWLDEELYLTPEAQSNPFYSLVTDTAHYYLTWTTDLNNPINRLTDIAPSGVATTPATHFMKEEVLQFNQQYLQGWKDAFGSSDPEYYPGEGWFRSTYGFNTNPSYIIHSNNLSVPQFYSGAGASDVELETVVVGANNAQQVPDHRFVMNMGTNNLPLQDTTWEGYEMLPFSWTFPASQVASQISNNLLTLKYGNAPLPNPPDADFQSVSHFRLQYPHNLHLENASEFHLELPTNNLAYTFFQASNFSTAPTLHFYDLTGNNRIAVTQSSDTLTVLVPPGDEKQCFVATENAIHQLTANDLQRVNSGGAGFFRDYGDMNGDSIDFVIISHPTLWTQATSYANYRNGRFNTLVVDVNDLYDQFAYGINKHPLSIRHFAELMLTDWDTPPDNLFLVGKSISEQFCRTNSANYAANLVPTVGFPSCDNMHTAGLNGTLYETAIPTGRLSAKNGTDVQLYLEKVVDLETRQASMVQSLDEKEWMKNVLHFGGGQNINEQASFKSNLAGYEQLIEDTLFGGRVSSFFKTENTQIQTNVSDSILTLLREGASLMTFFGHAGGGSFDISIDDPAVWENDGKYPLLIANSCLVGDIHSPVAQILSTSEEYVLTPNAGVIGFLSVVGLGYPDALHNFTSAFYYQLSPQNYGAPLGKMVQQAVKNSQNSISQLVRWTSLEFTLHGDPSIVLNPHEKPDFVLSSDRVRFEPSNLTTAVDSFALHVTVTNIGRGTKDTLEMRIIRDLPGTDIDSIYTQTFVGVNYQDDISFTLPIDPANGVGLNKFKIELDYPTNRIEELDDVSNNQLNIEEWVFSDQLFPIYPYNYAVVPDPNVTLKASTGSVFTPLRDYLFEIDTTDKFNSVSKQSGVVQSIGGVLEWQPNLQALQGQPNPDRQDFTYFWRVSPFNADTTERKWREFSFQVSPGETGWGQAHFFQFKEDEYTRINYNRPTRTFDFEPLSKNLSCRVVGNPSNQNAIFNNEYRIDGELMDYSFCPGGPSIMVAVIDTIDLIPWETYWVRPTDGAVFNPQHANYGNALNWFCRNRTEAFFQFQIGNSTQMDSLVSFLTNRVPDGYYILAYTARHGLFQDASIWGNRIQAFTNLGATAITTVGDSIPYIFFAKKGDPSTVMEVVGTHPFDEINLQANLSSTLNQGSIQSTLIGPAGEWGSLHWREYALEPNALDSVSITVFGVTNNGQEDSLASYPIGTYDVTNLNSVVNAQQYPFMRLVGFNQDESNQTPAQLDSWHVLYDPKPEAALNPVAGFDFKSDTLSQGEPLKWVMPIENVSDYDMDSLRISYYLETESGSRINIDYPTQAPLLAGDVLSDTLVYDTRSRTGLHTLWMEVNPRDSAWQLEQFHFNNLAFKSFFVNGDNTNPLLDVTFDGIHILDGDIVSTQPQIVVRLKDENEFLALDDTGSFQLFLIQPDGTQQQIHFVDGSGQEVIIFTPGSTSDNRATLEFQPNFTLDGTYELIVRGNDISGNASGSADYRISFEVVQQSTITEVLNYPNPFSTSTRFVFTLTGNQIPEEFTIQILTVTGKVVREITLGELGPIRIGRNITEYAWDGRDRYGDQLANGVYLYRVVSRINGEKIDKRETAADKFFHREFGKMYLMR